MTIRGRLAPVVIGLMTCLTLPAIAQIQDRRQEVSTPQPQLQPPNSTSVEPVTKEIGLLRKALQNLNTSLREISLKLFAPDSKPGESLDDKQKRIALNLDLLSRAEQRAEVLRKQLVEIIEKETSIRIRLAQNEEDMRPESVDRSVSGIGTTRTSEVRESRRRILELERKGLENLLNQTAATRARLEEDVRQSDSLVFRLRERLLPIIEKEIDKINPN
jgi:hypothetical protein